MPLPEEIQNVLKEKLTDVNIDDEPAMDMINRYFDSSNTVENLTNEIEQLRKAQKELVAERNKFKTKFRSIRDSQVTDEDKALLSTVKDNGGMTEEMRAEFNKMKADVETLQNSANEYKVQLEKNKEERFKIAKENAVTDLNSKLTSALTGKGFTDANLKAIMGIIQQDQHAKITVTPEKTFKKYIVKHNDNGEPIATDEQGLADYLHEKYPQFVQSSKVSGSGVRHDTTNNSSVNGAIPNTSSERSRFVDAAFDSFLSKTK